VPSPHRTSRRALIGNLDPVARLGMIRVLEDDGLEVVAELERQDSLVEEARRLQPDAIVIGADLDGSRTLTEQVRSAAPSAKVILWMRDESEMRVFDPGASAPRRIGGSSSAALLSELNTGRPRERE
jgi:DNA-binding NarL/FixJ family response regulator